MIEMGAIVLMFPGVGSQYTGMAKTFFDNFRVVRETLAEAAAVLDCDMTELCFSAAKQEELALLENSQAALLAISVAIYRVYMQEIGIEPRYCMGHSLGEYTALCCAGAIDFPDALRMVRQRGLIVNKVSEGLDGTMVWVVNLEAERVEQVCAEVSGKEGRAYISAYDTPTQTSVSGHRAAVMAAARRLEEAGAIVYPLKMSGPFHCPLMREACEQLKAVLEKYTFKQPKFTVIANQHACPYGGIEDIKENLALQLIQPIRFRASLRYLSDRGVDCAVEIGPKNVLKFLTQKNTTLIRTYSTDGLEDLRSLKDNLLVGEDDFMPVMARCLGALVSTRNYNDNLEEYREKVVKPYKKIESLYEELAARGKRPSWEQFREAVDTLCSVLIAKKVPPEWRQHKLDQVFRGKRPHFHIGR